MDREETQYQTLGTVEALQYQTVYQGSQLKLIGIHTRDRSNYHLQNCIASGVSDDTSDGGGITLRSPAVVSNCHFIGLDQNACTVKDEDGTSVGGSGSIITGCKFQDIRSRCIQVDEITTDVIINGNIFDSCTQECVYFRSRAGNASSAGANSVVSNNIFKNGITGKALIRVDGTDDITIIGNSIVDCR